MLSPIPCVQEVHTTDGTGHFILGRAEALAGHLCELYLGKAQLIYLDPPFGTGESFHLTLNGNKDLIKIPTYTDFSCIEEGIRLMRPVLDGCHKLLASDGSLYLHVDYRLSAQMRLLLDEIFGADHFANEIIWAYKSGGRSTKHFSRKHDTILVYGKTKKPYFNIQSVGVPRGPIRRNHMKRSLDEAGNVSFSIRSGGKLYTYSENSLIYPSDVWTDIEHLHQRDPERTGYATQKPEALLKRIILASSQEGGLVMDLFSGSGTTAVTAMKLNRRWIAADVSPVALSTLRNRLLSQTQRISFFEQQGNAVFDYPDAAYDHDLQNAIETSVQEDRLVVKLSENRIASAITYMAVGMVQDGAFIPAAYLMNPRPGDQLYAYLRPAPHSPAIHLSNYSGAQAFLLWQP